MLKNVHLLRVELFEDLPHAGGEHLVVHTVVAVGLFDARYTHDGADGVDNEVGIVQRDLDGGPVLEVEIKACELIFYHCAVLGRIYAEGIAYVSEAHLDGAGLGYAAVDERAGRLDDTQLLIAAVLEHICRGKVAGVDDDDLTVLEIWRDPFYKRFVIAGLDIDYDRFRLGDEGNIACYSVYSAVADSSVDFDERHCPAIFDHIVVVIIMHGV